MLDLKLAASTASTVAETWDVLGLNSELMHEVQRQHAYRAALAERLGGPWTGMVTKVSEALVAPPYAAVVRCGDAHAADRMLAAFAASFGRMVNPYRNRVAGVGLWTEVVAKGPASPDHVWLWHTDSVNWPAPNDYSAFICTVAAPEGGATEILSLETVRVAAGWTDTVLAPLWQTDYTWPVEGVLGGGSVQRKALAPGRLSFRRELMVLPSRSTSAYRSAVEAFAALADALPPDGSALLSPGDLLIFDNRKVMHRSGPVQDPERRRVLLRTKLMDESITSNGATRGASAVVAGAGR